MYLFCLYGPKKITQPFIMQSVKTKSKIYNSYIVVGDFNLVMCPEKDYFNYVHLDNQHSGGKVIDMMSNVTLLFAGGMIIQKKRSLHGLKIILLSRQEPTTFS